MKGIILAAGKGTRLYPLTKAIPKVLLPMYDRPMIYFALDFMKKANVEDVVIVVAEDQIELFKRALGSGAEFGLNLTYRIQKEVNGTAGAVKGVQDFFEGDDVLLYYGDNVLFGGNFDELISKCLECTKAGCASLLALEVANPSDYGVLEIADDGKIISLEEKPQQPKSNFIAPGIYFYPSDVVAKLDRVELSARGEYEMGDVNVMYLEEGRLSAIKMSRDFLWYDAGTFDSLLDAGVVIKNRVNSIDKR